MTDITFDPIRIFGVGNTVTGTAVVSKLLNAVFNPGATGSNQLVITAITGKVIRVMGWIAQSSTGTAGFYGFKSASGGSSLTPIYGAPPNTTGIPDRSPITNSGYFETNVGEGLYADTGTNPINMNVFYITYTPS